MGVLVTGTGLVGSHVARILQDRGESVVLVDVNPDRPRLEKLLDLRSVAVERVHLADLPEILRLIRTHGVTRIIHTASLTSDVWVHPYRGFIENVTAFANVLEAARLEGVTRVTISSSAAVYGLGRQGVGGDLVTEEASTMPVDVYGVTKLAGEHLGRNYEQLYGVEFTAVRYPVVIPPPVGAFRMIPNTDVSRVGYTIVAMVESAVRGERFVAKDWPRMEWGYCTDIAMGTVLANTVANPRNRVYNLGSGEPTTLSDVADLVRADIPGADIVVEAAPAAGNVMGQVVPNTTELDDAQNALDITRARKELGYAPAYSMRDVVRQVKDGLASRTAEPVGAQ
jgi:nucleoside-diphosphate-sugar epimerase